MHELRHCRRGSHLANEPAILATTRSSSPRAALARIDIDADAEKSRPRASAWAWVLCWLMFASTVLNYMDRQTITLVESQIRESFSIPDFAGFGWILSAFFMTYALFQVPAGYLVDRWDLRWSTPRRLRGGRWRRSRRPSCPAWDGCSRAGHCWESASRSTGRALCASRREFFHLQDRSLGNGIFNSGAAVGAVLTPIVVTFLSPRLGWRATFVVIGSLGFVWVAAWLFLVRGAAQRDACRPGHRQDDQADALERVAAALATGQNRASRSWRSRRLRSRSSTVRYGPAAIWLGIALAMLGPLAVAAFFPRHDLKGAELGDEPARDRPAPEVLDPGRRLDLDQYLLAFPG